MKALQHLRQIRQTYQQRKTFFYSLLLLAWTGFFLAVYLRWPAAGFFPLGLVLSGALGAGFWGWQVQQLRRLSLEDICRHLNRMQPELEESAHLALIPAASRTLFQKMQWDRVEPHLLALPVKGSIPFSFSRAWLTLAGAGILAAGLFLAPELTAQQGSPDRQPLAAAHVNAIRQTLPGIKEINILVNPPAYTGLPERSINTPGFKAEAEARITWEIRTTGAIRRLELAVPGRKSLAFQPVAGRPGTYRVSLAPTRSFIYTLDLNGEKSDFYAVELIPDLAPVLTIRQPGQYTEVGFGASQRIGVQADLTDDYGLRQVSLVATVAQGSGESVKFRQLEIPIGLPGTPRKHQTQKILDLKALGMTYGDELYFYLQARDNHRGYTRSETYLVRLEDTTVVTDGLDMAMPVSGVPAYFRSQRQLIIDTEKLLTQKKSLTPAVFQERSNNLAADQKILRLRYGKFLGEESETVIGPKGTGEEVHTADDGHDHGGGGEQSTSEKLLDPYIHKHDTEEDATFFEPTVKAKLKGALTQMWEAELRLRLSQPREALPFEYKALRLLKEVQQSSRAYVRKMGFNPPLIQEKEKRLTGELNKIKAPRYLGERETKTSFPAIRQVLPRLASWRPGQKVAPAEVTLLRQAGQELTQAALQQPGRFLRALQDLRQLTGEVRLGQIRCGSCLAGVTGAMEAVLPPPLPAPTRPSTYRHPLADPYFKRLK